MICAAVFETDGRRQETLRGFLTKFIFARSVDLDLYWFTDRQAVRKLETYAETFCLAFVSLDEEEGLSFGVKLSRHNPACRICYYKASPCDWKPLLASRPADFALWPFRQEEFDGMMDRLILETEESADFFCFAARREIYHIPVYNIIYFESDLKHVSVHCKKGEDIRLTAKLSEVEERLGLSFVRIHKSYIVNRMYVWKIDKKLHVCQLEGGTSLPISEAQYGNVVDNFTSDTKSGNYEIHSR